MEDDIHWLVARLFKRGDLSFTVNGESVNLNNRSEEEIIGYITKKQFVDKLLTEVRVGTGKPEKGRPHRDERAVQGGTACR